MSIVGGSDTVLGTIVIHEVYPDGAAAVDGRLKPGDQVLEVDIPFYQIISNHSNVTPDEKLSDWEQNLRITRPFIFESAECFEYSKRLKL